MRVQFLILLVLSITSYAQITITETDMPEAGDIYIKSMSNNINSGYDVSGADVFWDFSYLQANNQSVDTFVSSFSTNAAYALVFFNTIATPGIEFPNLIPTLTISENYDFFKSNSGNYSKNGMGAKVNGVPMPMEFDNNMLYYTLPLSYGNLDSSVSSYGLNIPNFGYYGQQIKRVNHTDGWGTVETPFGTFNVLRVRSDVHMIDTVYYDTYSYGTTFERDEVEYQWLATGMGIPVLTIIESGMQTRVIYQDSLLQTDYANIIKEKIRMYPNPVKGKLYFSCDAGSQVRIYDLKGNCISGLTLTDDLSIDVSHLKNGIYFCEIQKNNEITRRKIVVIND